MLLALGVAGGGILYVKNLQANLAISEANNAKLETGIEEQKKLRKGNKNSNDIFKKGRGKTLSRNQTNQIEDF